jgi:hypothetical protein
MRVGVRCSNPFCRKLTTGPRTESPFIVSIGVAAHITAASPGGPRYDLSLSSPQREAAENGLWLCQNCAKLIDNDPERYTAGVLREWKTGAEAAALAELEGQAILQPTDLSAEIDVSYEKKRITGERHDYCLQIALANRGTEPLGAYHIDLAMPAIVVSNPDAQSSCVEGRSTSDTAFFRVSSLGQQQIYPEIYPGDTRVVMSIPYYVDHEIYWGNKIGGPLGTLQICSSNRSLSRFINMAFDQLPWSAVLEISKFSNGVQLVEAFQRSWRSRVRPTAWLI